MKEVISGKELEEITKKGVNLICDAVGSTLGPSGNNVIINSDLSPYITNDGATIARTISSSDKRINTILELVKEASLKTNEKVGDGTTTTLVLLQSIYNEGLKEKNRIKLKKELNNKLDYIIGEINTMKRIPTKEELINIATISSGDEEIGKLVYEVYSKMNNSFSIKLDESNTGKTYYEVEKGYTLDVDISSLYFKDSNEIVLNNTYILIIRGYLDNLEVISDIINEGLVRNKNIVIFATDYDERIRNEILLYYLESKKNIFLFKTPDYASRKEQIEEDIKVLSNSKIKNIDYENIYFNDLGLVNKVIITKDNVSIINDNDSIDIYLEKLKKELKNIKEDYEKEFIMDRISKLEKGIATIYVGGNTKTEIKELIMRYEDALCAIDVAKHGIVKGEGITLLEISNKIDNKILKKALQTSFNKILENAGYESKEIKDEIIKSNYKKIFNLEKGKLESLNNIIDPALVVIEEVKNAISIATMLLTTNYLVINEEIEIDNNTL